MSVRKKILFGPALKAAIQPVLTAEHLGNPDRDRLLSLSEMSVSEKLPLVACLQQLYPGQPETTAQSNLRGFRKRLNDACGEAKLLLRFHADSGTRTPAAERQCWFTGMDPLIETVEQFSDDSTADVTRKRLVTAKGKPQAHAPGKRLVRFFISYAHADERIATQLMEELRRQFKPSLRYELDLWADRRVWADERIGVGEPWHDEIQRALTDCEFGLLLVSPAFLGSSYIGQHELPRFLGADGKPVVPVGLLPVDFARHDLKGLEKRQIFLRHFADSRPDRYFGDCASTAEKRRFAEELFRDIEHRLDKWFGPAPSPAALPASDPEDAPDAPNAPSTPKASPKPPADPHARDHFAAIAAGKRPVNLVEPRGFPASQRDIENSDATPAADKQATEAVPFITAWAKRPEESPFLAVLGEYGLGKTTTLQEVTRALLKEREAGDLSVPLPIYFDLRLLDLGDKARVPVLEEILADLLRRSWKLTDRTCPLTPADILRVVREERAVVIFDGLDEKLVHLTPDRGGQFIRELWSVLPPALLRQRQPGRGKVILSCRSHYFRDVWAQRAALCGEDREGLDPDRDYRLFLMLPFTEEQILRYLALTLRQPEDTEEQATARGSAAFDLIASIHNLTELAQRPYLLSLISGELESLEEFRVRGETVNAARLYDLVVKRWLGRDDGKHQLNPAHKRELMEHLAAGMWRSASKEWDADRLEEWLDTFLAENPRVAGAYANKDRDILKEDLRTATFVLRPDTAQASFRFAHTSLQEFFLAAFLVRALREGRPTAWHLPAPSEETLAFAGQLLELDSRRTEALGTLNRVLAGEGDTAEVKTPPQAALNAFRYWLRALRHGWPVPAPQRVRLPGADLEEWTIAGPTSGPPLNLRGAHLAGVQFSRARLERVDLTGADLTGAALRQALFLEVMAPQAQLAGADLCGLQWRGGSLARADLAGAQLAGCQWIQVELTDATLPGGWPHDAVAVPAGVETGAPARLEGPGTLLTLAGHTNWVYACAWSPDGQRLLSGSADHSLKVWDARSGQCLLTLEGHTDSVNACAWSPDGQRLLSGSDDHSLKVWDARSGQCLLTLAGHTNGVRACAWSPDGQRLLSGSGDHSLKVWDARSGQCLLTLEGHTDSVNACAWSPDGQRLLSGSDDHSLKVWDARSGQCLLTLAGHTNGVRACAWSPDGQRLLSGSGDHSLKVWDARSGQCLLTLAGHTNGVSACAWSPDGQRLLSGSWDHSLKVWDARSGQCLWTGVNLPELQTAALDLAADRILAASPEAWRFLGWRRTDPVTDCVRVLPAEIYGPLPVAVTVGSPSPRRFWNGTLSITPRTSAEKRSSFFSRFWTMRATAGRS